MEAIYLDKQSCMDMKTINCIADSNDTFYSLGIDTSNYTTSVAIIDNQYNIIGDERIPLEVSKGLRGLRQSDAVFKHINHLPRLIEKVFSNIDNGLIGCISVSTSPRPIPDSYMPVFISGQAISKSIASALNTHCFEFSHQEGHIRAGTFFQLEKWKDFNALHISGGTTEVLQVKGNHSRYEIEIIGGSKDISIGQLLDRIGVKMGLPFPSGKYLDELVSNYHGQKTKLLKNIYIDKTQMNLSGIETQCFKFLDKDIHHETLVCDLFDKIVQALHSVIVNTCRITGCTNMLLVGGVAASKYIRKHLELNLKNIGIHLYFADPKYSTDNAVGIAALGMDKLMKNE